MKFEIESRFDVGGSILTKGHRTAKVCDVKIHLLGNYYRIYYLIEFDDSKERKWIDENDIV